MKKQKILYSSGYALLSLAMLTGALITTNANISFDARAAEQEEAQRPAEIELTLITPSDCELCVDGNLLFEAIQKLDVRILDSKTLTTDSNEGTSLIATYGIDRAPAILVKGEYEKENVQSAFNQLAGEEVDNTLVIEIEQPVYVDLATNETVGLLDVTYLVDSSCTDCYDPEQHREILERNFGAVIQSETMVDSRSVDGREIIDQYNITQIPTIFISPEATSYGKLAGTWPQIGTVENDGIFVFRRIEALGNVVYRDLITGEIVRPNTENE